MHMLIDVVGGCHKELKGCITLYESHRSATERHLPYGITFTGTGFT